MTPDHEVTIGLTRCREPDALVDNCLRAIARQVRLRGRVLFFDQRPDADLDGAVAALSTPELTFERRLIPDTGISHARNLMIRACRTELLLCLDPDVKVEPDWGVELADGLVSGGASIVTGRILPRWQGRPPFLAKSSSVLEMYSVQDHGPDTRDSRKVVGGSFGMHLGRLGPQARFDEAMGRAPGRAVMGEDQELAERALAAGHRVLYCGRSVAHHLIPEERCRLSWLIGRVSVAGFDRGFRGGRPQPSHRMRTRDRILVLPLGLPYAFGFVRGAAARRRESAVSASG